MKFSMIIPFCCVKSETITGGDKSWEENGNKVVCWSFNERRAECDSWNLSYVIVLAQKETVC